MGSLTRNVKASSRAVRRDEMSRRLLVALEEHLATASFTEFSVDRLVREAGISRSAFYLHFADKGDLLRTLYVGVVGDLIAAAQTWWGLPPDATKAEFHEGFRVLLDAYRPHARLMRAVTEVASYDQDVRLEFDAHMDRAVGEVVQHIRSGQASGAIREGLDAEPVANCLMWMTERVLMQVLGTADDDVADRYLAGLVEVYWHTLYEGRRGGRGNDAGA